LLKLINGYWNGFDEEKSTLTPDKTNFLIPHISFIIKWKPGEESEYVDGGFLSFSPDQNAVFVSGGGKYTPLDILSNTYNHIMREKGQHPIELIGGDKIFTWFDIEQIRRVPISLNHSLKEESFLGDFLNDFMKQASLVKSNISNEEQKKIINTISCSTELARYIYQANIKTALENRKDTIRIIYKMIGQEIPEENVPEAFQKDMKDKETKVIFLREIFKRITDNALKVPEQDMVNKYAHLLNFFLQQAELKLSKEDATKFYILMNELLKDKGISQLRKNINKLIGSYSNDHSERFLMAGLSLNPKAVRDLLERRVNEKRLKIQDIDPRLKAIIIDSHSWLDVCSSCQSFLFQNSVWKEFLEDFQQSLPEIGFKKNDKKIRSLFRVFSEEIYENNPESLEEAGGGPDIFKRGFDLKVLSEKSIILASRKPRKEVLQRDLIIEHIWQKTIQACIEKPIHFWMEQLDPWKWLAEVSMKRDSARNGLELMSRLYPENKAIKLWLSHIYKSKGKEEYIEKAISFLESIASQEFSMQEREMLKLAGAYNDYKRRYFLYNSPQEYAKVYLGYYYLMLADRLVSENIFDQPLKYLSNWANECLLEKLDSQEEEDPQKKLFNRIVNYWQIVPKNEEYGTPEEVDKPNVIQAFEILGRLVLEGKNQTLATFIKENQKRIPTGRVSSLKQIVSEKEKEIDNF